VPGGDDRWSLTGSQVHSNTMTDWGPPWLAMLVLNDVSKKLGGN